MKISNKRAHYDYFILEKLEAGMLLTGPEVRSIKEGHMKLEGAYVRIIGGEAFLVNAEVTPNQYTRAEGYDPRRSRKLLLHHDQLVNLGVKIKQKRLTLVPTACYTRGHLLKLEIGIGRGKKEFDKREEVKKRDVKREVERAMKGRG